MRDDDEEVLVDYLISTGEAVEYGEPWTEDTTHEWWRDADGDRHVRMVMSYHGGGSRGDDDEAEYVRRLLDLGRAVQVGDHEELPDPSTTDLPAEVTHVIQDGKAKRFRFYVGPPDGGGLRTLLQASATGLPSSSRNGAKVIWVTLHTAEGARRAVDLYNYFNNNQNASSHVGIDSTGYYDWVSRDRAAWTLLNGNPISVNAELCGFARWTRAQWLSTGVVDGVVNPRAMVRHAAMWAKRECEALSTPKQYIGTDGVRARRAGVIIHWDYSRGTGNGDHWDTGSNFPFDVFFADMNATQEGEDMANVSDQEKAKLLEAADSVLEGIETKRSAGALFGLVAKLEGKVDALSAKVDTLELGGIDADALVSKLEEKGLLTATQFHHMVNNTSLRHNDSTSGGGQ